MRQLLPTYAEDVDLHEAYRYPVDRPWLRANMVTSLDGSAVKDGRSGGLGGPADKEVFGVLRSLCDAVLVGAGTARAEGYRAPRAKEAHVETRRESGQRPAPVLVLVTRGLDLDPAGALFTGTERTVVVTSGVGGHQRTRAAGRGRRPGRRRGRPGRHRGSARRPPRARPAAHPLRRRAEPARGPRRGRTPGRAVRHDLAAARRRRRAAHPARSGPRAGPTADVASRAGRRPARPLRRGLSTRQRGEEYQGSVMSMNSGSPSASELSSAIWSCISCGSSFFSPSRASASDVK